MEGGKRQGKPNDGNAGLPSVSLVVLIVVVKQSFKASHADHKSSQSAPQSRDLLGSRISGSPIEQLDKGHATTCPLAKHCQSCASDKSIAQQLT